MSVGPELYVGASAQPEVGTGRSLQGLTQRIAGPQGLSLASQLATKYVLRPSGFTGVYNADPDAGKDGRHGVDFAFAHVAWVNTPAANRPDG